MRYYIHIPFCGQKCPYCKFAVTPIFDEAKKRRYLAYLREEIIAFLGQTNKNGTSIESIYFGGGTPSVLSHTEIASILNLFAFDTRTEVSFECNPEDIKEDYLLGLFDLGINRLSLGIQSLDEETLKAVKRSDKKSILQALETIGRALLNFKRGGDFSISINIDFILGLPFTKKGVTLKNIDILQRNYPFVTHTSVYMLEDGEYPKEWRKDSITEIEMEAEYSDICDHFRKKGWNHYEISNWAIPGYESTHNQGYWNHENYHGFGLSATSYQDSLREENSESFSRYYQGEKKYREVLTEKELHLEKIIYAMRTFRLKSDQFKPEKILSLTNEKLLFEENGIIILTPAGIFRENTILSELIDADVAQW